MDPLALDLALLGLLSRYKRKHLAGECLWIGPPLPQISAEMLSTCPWVAQKIPRELNIQKIAS